MNKEAAVIVTTVTAFATALIALMVAFGIEINEDQRNAILGCLGSFFGVLLILGPIIRGFVFSKESVKEIRAASVKAGETDSPAPVVP